MLSFHFLLFLAFHLFHRINDEIGFKFESISKLFNGIICPWRIMIEYKKTRLTFHINHPLSMLLGKKKLFPTERYLNERITLEHMLRLFFCLMKINYRYIFNRWYHPNRNAYQVLFSSNTLTIVDRRWNMYRV